MRLIFAMLLMPLVAMSQTNKVEFSEVLQAKDVAASNLFVRAKLWFADSFEDSKRVLEVDDKDAGILSGKGAFAYEPNVLSGNSSIRGTIRFSLKITVKDGRYKIELSDFRHLPISISNPVSFGFITLSDGPASNWSTKNVRKKIWKHMQDECESHAKELIESLKTKMGASPSDF
jgi:hypothetical protein